MLTYHVDPTAVPRGTLVPTGRPLANTQVYVLSPEMQLVSVGVVGEIYIGGDCVARGYLNRPELTAERFVPDPFSNHPGSRLYRTGDLARWLPEGVIEFRGRTDYQVKIRGFRIELGEIEETLKKHADVEKALVLARDGGEAGKRLVAYVVATSAEADRDAQDKSRILALKPLSIRLQEFLKERLPDYMIPFAVIVLDTIPQSPQGKVDLLSMPAPSLQTALREEVEMPRNLMQAQLIEIWEEVLETSPIGITNDFFQLGGHSLLAVRMMTMIRKRFKRGIPLASLFQNPTVAHLAKLLAQSTNEVSPSILVDIQPEGSGTPFFCVHPIGGGLLCYVELARALGRDRPIYGLQAPVPDPQQQAITSIEQMAKRYNDQLQRVQPEGPYLLGGWSMGGLVAFEMARQLSQRGKRVDLLALFDTYPPIRNRRVVEKDHQLPIIVRIAADMSWLLGKESSELRERFLQLDENEQRTMLLEILKHGGMLTEDTSNDEVINLMSILTQNAAAADAYALQHSQQKIVLFRAADAEVSEQIVKQWEPWVAGGVKLHLIPGDHYSMLKQPHVLTVAQRLKHCFDEVQQETNRAAM
jgi:thioesterase domain-containing protein/acyl carrier protein